MGKIRFFFLQVLFFGAPLIYAWFYIPFFSADISSIAKNISGLPWSWFESVKVTFLFFCLAGALLFHIPLLFQKKNWATLSTPFILAFLIVAVWTIISLYLNADINQYFSHGNPEKWHGWFFYMALFVLFFLLRSLSSIESKKLMYITFFAFGGVYIYALFQKFWFDPLQDFYETRLDSARIFSTLGNPNYLAGLVLMILPLLQEIPFFQKDQYKTSWNICIWFFGGLLIYWTGSYLAWIFFALYMLITLVHHFVGTLKHRYIFWTLFLLACLSGAAYIWYKKSGEILEMQKMKGFIARFYLWETAVAALKHDVLHFLFWYGPDGFLSVSEYFRHPLLSVYEDPTYRIDRSHNVFLDFALHFWMIIFILVIFLIVRTLKYRSSGQKIALLLFALYFSFNIPVLVHFLVLLQIFTSTNELSEMTSTWWARRRKRVA
jgi:hypothetical protein